MRVRVVGEERDARLDLKYFQCELSDVQEGLRGCTHLLSVRRLPSKVTGGAPESPYSPLSSVGSVAEQELRVCTFITPRDFIPRGVSES